jgi:hypothetical protein
VGAGAFAPGVMLCFGDAVGRKLLGKLVPGQGAGGRTFYRDLTLGGTPVLFFIQLKGERATMARVSGTTIVKCFMYTRPKDRHVKSASVQLTVSQAWHGPCIN